MKLTVYFKLPFKPTHPPPHTHTRSHTHTHSHSHHALPPDKKLVLDVASSDISRHLHMHHTLSDTSGPLRRGDHSQAPPHLYRRSPAPGNPQPRLALFTSRSWFLINNARLSPHRLGQSAHHHSDVRICLWRSRGGGEGRGEEEDAHDMSSSAPPEVVPTGTRTFSAATSPPLLTISFPRLLDFLL